MADDYWDWYQSAFGAPAQQGPAPGPAPLTPQQWDTFYRSVGIEPQGPTTRSVQSVPVRPPQLLPTNVAAYSTLAKGSSIPEDYRYNTGMRAAPRIDPSATDRLTAGVPGIGGGMEGITPQRVAQIGVDLDGNAAPMPFPRPVGTPTAPLQILVDGANPIQTAKVAPVPYPPYRSVGSQVDTMPPLPMARPQRPMNGLPMSPPSGTIMQGADGKHYQFGSNGQWMTTTMAPMPMAQALRPGAPVAPTPVTRQRLAIGAMPAQRAPLRIAVSGANPIAPPNPILNAARSVNQSGDYSSGNQFEVANLLASGNSWREAQARKK